MYKNNRCLSKPVDVYHSKREDSIHYCIAHALRQIAVLLSITISVVLLVAILAILAGCQFSADKSSSDKNDSSVSTVDIDNNAKDEEVVAGENPICDSTMSVDGLPGGFTWKPVAEAEGDDTAVVLFPAEFVNRFTRVFAYTLEGDEEEAVFSGFTNGGRQTWRFPSTGENYKPEVHAEEFSQVCVWIFPDSSVRQD